MATYSLKLEWLQDVICSRGVDFFVILHMIYFKRKKKLEMLNEHLSRVSTCSRLAHQAYWTPQVRLKFEVTKLEPIFWLSYSPLQCKIVCVSISHYLCPKMICVSKSFSMFKTFCRKKFKLNFPFCFWWLNLKHSLACHIDHNFYNARLQFLTK